MCRTFKILLLIHFFVVCICSDVVVKDTCVADMYMGEVTDAWLKETHALIQSNHQSWAKCHGYTYIHQTQSLNAHLDPHWTKLYLIKNLLSTKCSRVLFLDFDALFMHCGYSIDYLFGREKVLDNEVFIFSGDTNIINSGVMIFKRSEWVSKFLDDVLAIGPTPGLGMGYENTALAIALVGCHKNSTRLEREQCYNRSDYAYIEKTQQNKKTSYYKIMLGIKSTLVGVVDHQYIDYIHLMPHNWFNSYKAKSANFIVHFPGQAKKNALLNRIASRVECVCNQTSPLRSPDK